jgi:hypothetical protein
MASRSILTSVDSPSAHRQSKPIPAKHAASRIPAPQSIRIMQRYAQGASIRKISREEGRDRAAVTKIVKSPDMHAHVERMREKFYGLADLAIAAVQRALEDGDAQVGYRFLLDIGVIPSLEERMQLQTTPAAHDPNKGFKDQMAKVVEIMLERRHIYNTPFPELDEDVKKAGFKINAETGQLEPIEEVSSAS